MKDIYKRIYDSTGTKTQVQLAKVLGITQTAVSETMKRNALPDSWVLTLLKNYGISPEWIVYGKGDMHIVIVSRQTYLSTISTLATTAINLDGYANANKDDKCTYDDLSYGAKNVKYQLTKLMGDEKKANAFINAILAEAERDVNIQ